MSNAGAVILAGGKSSRMGKDKGNLILKGKTFLEGIVEELEEFPPLLLSLGSPDSHEAYSKLSLQTVHDLIPGCGPVGGLYSALTVCKPDWLLAVSCDMPLFVRGLGEYLVSYISGEYDAIIAEDRNGRIHPLCGVYRKSAAGILLNQIEAKDYKMTNALKNLKVKTVSLRHSVYRDEILQNINTPEEYARLCGKTEEPPLFAISGVKNSGKTTLLEGLLPVLCKRGLRIAVIKHDGHDFVPDVPGTDSYRMRQAGAFGVAVYSDYRYMLAGEQPEGGLESLIKQFKDADMILLEGGKHTSFPKLEVVREGVSCKPVCEKDSLLGICTDIPKLENDCPVKSHILSIDDYEGIAEFLLKHYWQQREGALCATAMAEV